MAEAVAVDDSAREELRVTRVGDLHLAHHLAEDRLDVLVIDRHGLAAIDVLDLAQEVVLHVLLAVDAQDVLRVERPVDERKPQIASHVICKSRRMGE